MTSYMRRSWHDFYDHVVAIVVLSWVDDSLCWSPRRGREKSVTGIYTGRAVSSLQRECMREIV